MKIYEWGENKRLLNLAKHGLDFADADEVLSSPYRFDVETERNGEARIQSFAYSFGRLLVLSLAHSQRAEKSESLAFAKHQNLNERHTMHTYNKPMNKSDLLKAIQAIPLEQDFVWDGINEDERPVTQAEFNAAIKKRGRPQGSKKELVSLRLDKNILDAFRATGKGWQSRINDALAQFIQMPPNTSKNGKTNP